MAVKLKLKHLLFLSALGSPIANAGAYIALAPALIHIKTDDGSTKPFVTDLRLGYAYESHKVELTTMSSISNDNLNQLETDVPAAAALFYRYTIKPKSSLSVDVILGYSQIDIDFKDPMTPLTTETFEGVSFGVGLEEALKSIPQLKFKLDLIQLYRGDRLNINSLSLGLRYEF
ncbi:hypothetical protein MNBD_GAMMA09-1650 [hydrothermal vent metagenome]|uniref:Outer membrane protein beta-barrel domain-containing protein n=1 Tax=hydrothermal vent metagenome TaxID=652676 RepID=A0A3B0XP43_9ZZZZ